jgi:hypothetical protein
MEQKAKLSHQSPKTEFSYPLIYPLIEDFTCSKKRFTFVGKKSENKPLDPKIGIWSPKSV